MAFATDIRPAATGFGARITNLRSELATRYAQYRVYRTTLNELADLTDRDLADLGIARSMIKGIAIEAAYGK